MTPPRRSRSPTVLAERHHRTSHVCPTMYHRIPRCTTHRTVWDNVGHVGSPKYIDNAMSPYRLLCLTHVIKFNTLLSLLKVFDFDLTVLPPSYSLQKAPDFTVLVQPVTSTSLSSTKPNHLISQHRLSYC
jgi:hypothetical protein